MLSILSYILNLNENGISEFNYSKNVFPRLQIKEDLEAALIKPNTNIVEVGEIDEEVEIDKEPDDTLVNIRFVEVKLPGETEYVVIKDVDNIILTRVQKINQH